MDRAPMIADVGMSEGNDTAFYLAKGFFVVGVEANPDIYEDLTKRFAKELAKRELHILHGAAHSTSGREITFYRNSVQGHSSIYGDRGAGTRTPVIVNTINWSAITELFGVPYYAKLDIEGAEIEFLKGLTDEKLPRYISVECHDFEVVGGLYNLGYRRFKLINQTVLSTLPIPNPPLEGNYVASPNWSHSSGPFGKELPGQWFTFSTIAHQFMMLMELRNAGGMMQPWVWFDCHASLA